MSATFFKSENVNIFPCARRGNYTEGGTNKTYNAESRFVSEANLTKLSGLAFGRDSYIISRPATASEEGIWKLVIKGYYFEIGVEENELQSEGYFIIGLEDTSGIPRIRLAALAESSDSLGINKGAASLDAEGRCRAICFISLDGEPSGDALYHVYSEDTLENLDKSYFFEGARKEENDLTTLLKIQNGIDLINAKFGEEYSSENTVAQAISGVRGSESDKASDITVYGVKAYAESLVKQLSGGDTEEEAPKTLSDEIIARKNADDKIREDFAAADTTTLQSAQGYADTKKTEVIGTSGDASTVNTVYGAKKHAEEKAAAAQAAAEATAANDATAKANAAEANAKTHAETKASAAETTAKGYADSQDAALKTAIIGGDTDTPNDATIAGAKKYAEEKAEAARSSAVSTAKSEAIAEVVGVETNTDADNTIWGAKAYARKLVEDLTGVGQEGEAEAPASLAEETKLRMAADKAIDERLDKVEAFFVGAAKDSTGLDDALDKLVDIQNYLNGDGSAANGLMGQVSANTTAIDTKLATNDFNTWKGTHESGHAKPADEITSEISNAVSGEETARKEADKAITDAIGTSTDGKDAATVYGAIADAKAAGTGAASEAARAHERLDTVEDDLQNKYLAKADVSILGIYAVAFDLSGNLEELSSDFKAATSRPIVFISECSTLPSPPEGYTWFDSPNEDAQEVKTIDTNIILYLKKINSPEEEKDPEDTPVE